MIRALVVLVLVEMALYYVCLHLGKLFAFLLSVGV